MINKHTRTKKSKKRCLKRMDKNNFDQMCIHPSSFETTTTNKTSKMLAPTIVAWL